MEFESTRNASIQECRIQKLYKVLGKYRKCEKLTSYFKIRKHQNESLFYFQNRKVWKVLGKVQKKGEMKNMRNKKYENGSLSQFTCFVNPLVPGTRHQMVNENRKNSSNNLQIFLFKFFQEIVFPYRNHGNNIELPRLFLSTIFVLHNLPD